MDAMILAIAMWCSPFVNGQSDIAARKSSLASIECRAHVLGCLVKFKNNPEATFTCYIKGLDGIFEAMK